MSRKSGKIFLAVLVGCAMSAAAYGDSVLYSSRGFDVATFAFANTIYGELNGIDGWVTSSNNIAVNWRSDPNNPGNYYPWDRAIMPAYTVSGGPQYAFKAVSGANKTSLIRTSWTWHTAKGNDANAIQIEIDGRTGDPVATGNWLYPSNWAVCLNGSASGGYFVARFNDVYQNITGGYNIPGGSDVQVEVLANYAINSMVVTVTSGANTWTSTTSRIDSGIASGYPVAAMTGLCVQFNNGTTTYNSVDNVKVECVRSVLPTFADNFESYTTGGASVSLFSENFNSYGAWGSLQGQGSWTTFGTTSDIYVVPGTAPTGFVNNSVDYANNSNPNYAWAPLATAAPVNGEVLITFDVAIVDSWGQNLYKELNIIGRDGTGGQYPNTFQISINGGWSGNNYDATAGGVGFTGTSLLGDKSVTHFTIDAKYATHTYTVSATNGSTTWTSATASWTPSVGTNGSVNSLTGLMISGGGAQGIFLDNLVVKTIPIPEIAYQGNGLYTTDAVWGPTEGYIGKGYVVQNSDGTNTTKVLRHLKSASEPNVAITRVALGAITPRSGAVELKIDIKPVTGSHGIYLSNDYFDAVGCVVWFNSDLTFALTTNGAARTFSGATWTAGKWYRVTLDATIDPNGTNSTYNVTIQNLTDSVAVGTETGVSCYGDFRWASQTEVLSQGSSFGQPFEAYFDNWSVKPVIATCQDVQNQGYGIVGDVNKDCYVNFKDVGMFASQWLQCNDPVTGNCH